MTISDLRAGPDTDLEEFRQSLRGWLSSVLPTGWTERNRGQSEEEFVAFQQWWFATMRDAGYAVPHWPREWGGGYDLDHQVVIFEELARVQAPHIRLSYHAIHHAAETLFYAGTKEQQDYHLPRILAGEEIWCQGFSEPNAGSDLASLRTRAVRDGDHYVINGQKVWTSYGPLANWTLLLARTDPSKPKRKGISYFMLDLTTPGVEIRSIRQATGASDFAEMFLTDVRIPVANRIGPENQGWQVAQATLAAERGLGVVELAERVKAAFQRLIKLADQRATDAGRATLDDPHFRRALAEKYSEIEILRMLGRRLVANLREKGGPGPEASIIKLYYSRLLQGLTELGAIIDGLPSFVAKPLLQGAGWETDTWLIDHIGSWAWTIAAGSNEIQRTVIGERVLGLPREPSQV